ncbi:MAG TPA: 50S ribosomal protein L21 [Oligoflexia bacterium]|nr:50S ribosomal protein L21 [Oligoflexia bacterium]
MYAIIETGGKQYRVAPGEVHTFEHINGNVGDSITFDKVLLVGTQGGDTSVGTPYVNQATAIGEIVQQTRGEKLLTIKYRRRKGYRRTIGHRQELTRVLVTKLANGAGSETQYDSAKRNELLIKASVPFAAAKTEKPRKAKLAAAPTSEKAAKTATKKAPAKKASKKEA